MLNQGGQARAVVAIDVSRGDCHVDFAEQSRWMPPVKLQQVCQPGTVETRCEPSALSVKCDAACKTNSTCKGRPEKPCNYIGKCESTCDGSARASAWRPTGP